MTATASLSDILLDRKHGAAELLGRAVRWLAAHPEALGAESRRETLSALRQTRSEMPGFASLASRLEDQLTTHAEADPKALVERIADRLADDEARVAENACRALEALEVRRLVTLSYSSSVARAIEGARELLEAVEILESHPGGEGRRLWERLRATLRDVRLHRDDELATVVGTVDAGLIGADAVFADGSVLNKILSARLAERLHQAGKPLLVLASTWKRTRQSATAYDHTVFEMVPARWIAQVVAESVEGSSPEEPSAAPPKPGEGGPSRPL